MGSPDGTVRLVLLTPAWTWKKEGRNAFFFSCCSVSLCLRVVTAAVLFSLLCELQWEQR